MKKSGIIFATIALLAGFGVAPAVFADGTGTINATVEDSNVAPTISNGTANYNFGNITYSWIGGKASLQNTSADPDGHLTVRSLSNTDGYKLTATVTDLTNSAKVDIPDQDLTLTPFSETSVTPSQATLSLTNGSATTIKGTITYTIQPKVSE